MSFSNHSHSRPRHTHAGKNRAAKGRRSQPESTLHPTLFIKKAVPLTVKNYTPTRTISQLPIDINIKANLIAKGYSVPTEIQDRTLEVLLEGRDLLGIAQTGTGKTGAFLVPLVQNLLQTKPANQILIVVPTRELAVQVAEEFSTIADGLGLRQYCFIGGTSTHKDLITLRKPAHIIIGTPGRLTDLARQRALNLGSIRKLVLDEFDRLLDMGFLRDIQFIVQSMTQRDQTLLFSATEDKSQLSQIKNLLRNPAEVRVSDGQTSGDHIEQNIVQVKPGESKMNVLINMVRDASFQKVIVFAETKRGASQVRKNLHQSGIRVDEIHGNKSQNYRLRVLNDFKSGKIQVLIATDVAARGLDISEVTHVINFQQPRTYDSYIHRIGRTGRAGKGGKAYTFVN